ncbi:O-antigen ligase [Bradyrhizobium sp. CER78]|uniref:O-antigen ligase family protein n=1 Tax=Bradyrhizobium sp. CER78 TaxID=3039162 RepID=UPI0024489EDF|nr:O-antigen ligase [Bradyrhizobium sp. CER78]MDH2380858.1 O-antigen ligase [Bradyrhizobium sp. CER78]
MMASGDIREGGTIGVLGPPLFVVTLLFYLITLTPFIDLSAANSGDPAADKSNTVNQIVFLGLTASLWLTAISSPVRRLAVRPRGVLIMTLLWFAFVSAISAHPDLALKRVVLATLTIVNAGIFLLLPRSERQFAGMLSMCCIGTLAFAYIGVALWPQLAIHQASEVREPMNAGLWRGHFAHKNVAAAAMVIISFAGLYLYSTGRRMMGSAITLLAVVFLTQTGGKSSTAALPGILVIAGIFERWRAIRVPMVFMGIAAFNVITIGCSISPAMRELVASLGIDPTFTNRIDIWRVGASAVADRPLTGYGFQLFWQTDEMVYKAGGGASWAVGAFNAHNAYLDAAITTGIPGLMLTLALLVWLPLRDVSQADMRDNDPALTRLFTRIWLYGVFSACVESLYFQSGSLVWFMVIVSIFGLRLQAGAHEIRESEAVMRVGEPAHA